MNPVSNPGTGPGSHECGVELQVSDRRKLNKSSQVGEEEFYKLDKHLDKEGFDSTFSITQSKSWPPYPTRSKVDPSLEPNLPRPLVGFSSKPDNDTEEMEIDVNVMIAPKDINSVLCNTMGPSTALATATNSSRSKSKPIAEPGTVKTPRERKKWDRPSSTFRSEPLEDISSGSADSAKIKENLEFQPKDYFGNLVSQPKSNATKSNDCQSQDISESKSRKISPTPLSTSIKSGHGKSSHSKDLASGSDFDFKSAMDVSLDVSWQGVPSPASSVASNKLQGLEWDSGADVGYRHPTDTSLSTIERLVHARGSTAFQLHISEVNATRVQESEMEETPAKHSNNTTRETKSQQMSLEPLAQSTPLEVGRRSLILTASNKDMHHKDDFKQQHKLSRKKSLSASDLQSASESIPSEKQGIAGRRNEGNRGFSSTSKSETRKLSYPSSVTLDDISRVGSSKSETSNKFVQTSDRISRPTQSVGVQVENIDSLKDNTSSSSSEQKHLTVEDAEKFIQKIQKNAKAHQKVIDQIRLANTYPRTSSKTQHVGNKLDHHQEAHNSQVLTAKCGCDSDCKGAHKKMGNSTESADERSVSSSRATLQLDEESKSGSSSSSYMNDTPRSGNATNDRETIGSANSFEYLPGDAYENNKANMKASPNSAASNSLSRDLQLGVDALLQQTENADPKQIKLLVRKLKERLILTDYRDDSVSSARDKSLTPETTSQKPHHGNRVVSGSSDSVYKSATSVFDTHYHKPHSDTIESGHSTFPCDWSSSLSSTSTLETRNWREAITHSEKRLEQRWTGKRPKSSTSDKQLAQINEKIHHLSNLKMILERQEKLRSSCEMRADKLAKSTLPETTGKKSRSSDMCESDTTPSPADQLNVDWSSHIHLSGNKRNIQTQMPSARYAPSSGRQSSSSNCDTYSDHRAKHGRINVYVQTRQKHNTASSSCGCHLDSILPEKSREQNASASTTLKSCLCHTNESLIVAPRDKYRPIERLRPATQPISSAQEMSLPYHVCHKCNCPVENGKISSSSESSRHFPLDTGTRPASAVGNKPDTTSDSVVAPPIVKPAWFAKEGSTTFERKTKISSIDSRFDVGRRTHTPQQVIRPTRCCNCHHLKTCQCTLAKGRNNSHGSAGAETPRSIGYMLTFESSTSINESTSSEPVVRKPLEVVTLRVPSRKQKPDSAWTYKSHNEVHSPSRPSKHKLAPSQSSTQQRKYSSREEGTDGPTNAAHKLTLQECLQNRRPDYIQSAEYRRECIAELAHLRELRRESRQRMLALASQPGTRFTSQAMPPPPMAIKRVFNQQKMLRQTKKLQQKCSEVVNKKVEVKRKEAYRTNRLMAEIFTRKLQKKVLQGAVSLSNSVSVISTLDI